MKRFVPILLSAVICFAAAGLAQDKYMVMSIKGKVEAATEKSKAWKKIEVGQVLGNNTIVRTSFASYVKLMVNETRLISIDENATRLLSDYSTKKNPAAGGGMTGKILEYAAQHIRRTKEKKSSTDFGAVRGGMDVFTAVFPKNRILTSTPTFQWVDASEDTSYTLLVLDEAFAVIDKQRLQDRTLQYPEGNTVFIPGKTYYWRVTRNSDGEASEIQSFNILPFETVATITSEVDRLRKELIAMGSDDITMHLIMAMYFEKQSLFTDAFREYKTTITLAPAVEEYRVMMKNLLLNMRLYNEEEYLMR